MINLLEMAAQELNHIRAERDRLAIQIDIVNIFRAALLGPPQSQGYGVDVAWTLRKRAEELRCKAAAAETAEVAADEVT